MNQCTNPFRPQHLLCTFLAAMLFATSASAKDYKVEVLIFENLEADNAFEKHYQQTPKEHESEAEIWLIEPSMLLEQAEILETAEIYTLLTHLSWGQESLPLSESAAMRIIEPNIDGWVKVYANELLFANLDLDFNGYRMQEKRRLRLDEVHFFDHPKFGVLIQVSRLPPPEDQLLEMQLDLLDQPE